MLHLPSKPQIRKLELTVRFQILDTVVRKGPYALFNSRGKCNVHLELSAEKGRAVTGSMQVVNFRDR